LISKLGQTLRERKLGRAQGEARVRGEQRDTAKHAPGVVQVKVAWLIGGCKARQWRVRRS
jgi:hypothetical protein